MNRERRYGRRQRRAGFTLIELIMVIVILGVLAAVAVPKYFDLKDEAKISSELGVAGSVRAGIAAWRAKYPVEEDVPASPAGQTASAEAWPMTIDGQSVDATGGLFAYVLEPPLDTADGWVRIIAASGTNGGTWVGPATTGKDTLDVDGDGTKDVGWQYTNNDGRFQLKPDGHGHGNVRPAPEAL
ncbi:MAG: type II secretion system protein [Deltaproteobacteria bacterium]|nr:type II secretion system protein [Candidatus Anaeroferrophillacea bacterium]